MTSPNQLRTRMNKLMISLDQLMTSLNRGNDQTEQVNHYETANKLNNNWIR